MLFLREENLGVGHIGLPLRVNLEIVVHFLMAEEHVLISPVGCDHSRLCLQLGDQLLGTVELSRLVHGIDIE